ncbi:malto-oligosyltrehalose trehalohydrolase [Paracoccus liaowanqingii]|uniref:Malto-oligosyltrehalose trehalohydrolase n=1 Tax=Paracoccus liaowanqingii TaxID=2560053 RepID=A0A4Z1C921_9RHOB|nr:malto-oligosyltrehalose trehalohydrolase [Paracoccus liaowanqingii]TGN59758.1 malto-oligosyltrehalose trehalohydrolase [Paracoccus liaowanqingii]
MTRSSYWGPVRGTDGWTFRLWAPRAATVDLLIDQAALPMAQGQDGLWSLDHAATPGATYRFRVDGQEMPDPASRLQAGGVADASVLLDSPPPRDWPGRDWSEAVIYELHVGTFTPEGTLTAATGHLAHLAALGFTAIQLMPVGQFPGDRGWGYDGVLPFAPHPAYGSPGDLRRLVEAAHREGLMVILDLVMNHFGPEGAWLHHSSPDFFDEGRQTPWGAAINFDRPQVRDFWSSCALHWLEAYGIDGLRLDAVHQIAGPGADAFMADLATQVHDLQPRRHLITEDERNIPDLREAGYDATWNDDFHHAVHVALTGESDSYYAPFAADPVGDLALALQRGHVEEGQPRPPRDELRGAPCGHLHPVTFVNSTQTHDQVGNRAQGDRLLALADPEAVAAVYGLLLVAPFVPMVFMGEERGETAPFQFFADFTGDLAAAVRKGRAAEFAGIAALGDAVPDPLSPDTMARSRLGWAEDERARDWMALTRRALDFRAAHVVPLLKSGMPETSVTRDGPGLIRATWRFPAGGLTLSLALGQTDPAPLADADFSVGAPDASHSLTVKALPSASLLQKDPA